MLTCPPYSLQLSRVGWERSFKRKTAYQNIRGLCFTMLEIHIETRLNFAKLLSLPFMFIVDFERKQMKQKQYFNILNLSYLVTIQNADTDRIFRNIFLDMDPLQQVLKGDNHFQLLKIAAKILQIKVIFLWGGIHSPQPIL